MAQIMTRDINAGNKLTKSIDNPAGEYMESETVYQFLYVVKIGFVVHALQYVLCNYTNQGLKSLTYHNTITKNI